MGCAPLNIVVARTGSTVSGEGRYTTWYYSTAMPIENRDENEEEEEQACCHDKDNDEAPFFPTRRLLG